MKKNVRYFFDIYMYIVGVLGPILFYAQAYKIFSTQSAGDVSLFGFIIGLISTGSWLVYGFFIKDWPLIVSSIAGVLGILLVLCGIFLYA